MKRKYQHTFKTAKGNMGKEWEEYFDTNDPYQLIKEAQEARALLASGFIQGSEFALTVDDDGDAAISTPDFAHPAIKYVCSIGAVFRIQGHHAYDCNLIQQLGKSAWQLTPPNHRIAIEDINEDSDWGELVVDVNDSQGREAALEVFDYTIAEYQAQIDYAESMAAQYMGAQSVSAPFRIGPHYKPINYCGPNGCTPTPVDTEVKIG